MEEPKFYKRHMNNVTKHVHGREWEDNEDNFEYEPTSQKPY